MQLVYCIRLKFEIMLTSIFQNDSMNGEMTAIVTVAVFILCWGLLYASK